MRLPLELMYRLCRGFEYVLGASLTALFSVVFNPFGNLPNFFDGGLRVRCPMMDKLFVVIVGVEVF